MTGQYQHTPLDLPNPLQYVQASYLLTLLLCPSTHFLVLVFFLAEVFALLDFLGFSPAPAIKAV